MRLRLKELHLRNFKGARSFDFTPDGHNADVFGSNAAGKTTIADAWTWLLFGKDSHNSAKFEIKTLDETGQPTKHGIEHSVEAALDLAGQDLTLRKVFQEVWTKKRGQPQDQFTGHKTEHYIDDVPVQKKEYDARIAEIADEGTFRLLCDPTYFNQVLHWKDRRQILLEVCGDVSDEDVIAANAKLAPLPEILGKHSIEQYQEIAAAKRRKIQGELDDIPTRISEVERNLPAAPGGSKDDLTAQLANLRERRGELEEEKARTQAGGEVAEKTARLRELEDERHQVTRKVKASAEEQADQARRDAREAHDAAETQAATAHGIERDRLEVAAEIERLEKRMDTKRTEWTRVNARTFDAGHQADTCPACGQALPTDQVEEAHRKAREEFNAKKSNELQEIQAQGKADLQQVEKLEAKEANLAEQLEVAEEEQKTLAAKAERLTATATELAAAVPDPTEDPGYQKIAEQVRSMEAEIEQLRAGTRDAVDQVRQRITAVDEEIQQVEGQLAAFDQLERGNARIKQLSDQEQTLNQQLENLLRNVHLIEEFIRAKVRMLEAKINDHFELARFKLFEEQINGGLTETCVATVDGVPYDSLNGGARTNLGLDIIRTLSEHYDFTPPIFVDNAESVVNLLPVPGQVIRLVVSGQDKTLRTEIQEEVAA